MDNTLFEFFNQTIANGFFDQVLPAWRTKETWIPLYVLLLAWMLYKDWKKGLIVLVAVAIAAGLADFITSGIMKPWFGRIRPCYAPEWVDQVRVLVPCGGELSFPSSHASNHLAIALVLNWCWFRDQPWIKFAWLFWAISIALAQIYVGKHYPFDILGGWAVGALTAGIGIFIFQGLQRRF